MNENATLLQRLVRALPESSSLPGEVLMSGVDTLGPSTKLTIMGFNPGGEGLPAVSAQFEAYLSNPNFQRCFSAYLHQCWHEGYWPHSKCPRCKGPITVADNHQRRVRDYCELLGVAAEEALSLNAIFFQTKRLPHYRALAKARGLDGTQLFQCSFWPIHRWLLTKATRTRVLLCLGNGVADSAFSYVREACGVSDQPSILRPYRDGRYFWYRDLLVVGVGHPSLIEVNQKSRDLLIAAGEYIACGKTVLS